MKLSDYPRGGLFELDEDELFWRACSAYERYCEKNMFIYQQPAMLFDVDDETSSFIDWGNSLIILRNVHGELARYRITKSRIVKVGTEE